MTGPTKYFNEVVREGKRVRWPQREIFIPTFIAVFFIALIGSLLLALDDLAASTLIKQLKEAFQSWLGKGASSGDESTGGDTATAAIALIRNLLRR